MLKESLKKLLRRFDRKLVYAPRGQVWGSDLREDLATLIRSPAPLCLDIGANEGQTIDFLRSVFADAQIHAFEPSPTTFARLAARQRVENVWLYNLGVGREKGLLGLNEYPSSDLSSFLTVAENPESRFSGAQAVRTVEVEVTTVDDFVAAQSIDRVDLLKSDTQGFELQVLEGASGALRSGRVRTVLLEMNFLEFYEGQAGAAEIIQFLHGLGFGLVDLYEKERVNNCVHWCNALFVPRR